MVCAQILITLLLAAEPAADTVDFVLPPGQEQVVKALAGRHFQREPLPGGWTLSDIYIEPHYIRYTFQKEQGAFFDFVLEHPSKSNPLHSKNFSMRIGDHKKIQSQKELKSLEEYLSQLIGGNDNGPSLWVSAASQGMSYSPNESGGGKPGQNDRTGFLDRALHKIPFFGASHSVTEDKTGRHLPVPNIQTDQGVDSPNGTPKGSNESRATNANLRENRNPKESQKYPVLIKEFDTRIPISPNLFYQLVLIASLLLIASRYRALKPYFARVPLEDWVWLGGWMIVGATLRLWGGIKIPAHVNGHGYSHVYSLLFAPPHKVDFWGAGNYALHGIFQLVFPNSEASMVGVHVFFSLMTIPAMYALSRLWLGSRNGARVVAAMSAVLPSFAFYAASDERYIPGLFFMISALILIGLAMRDDKFTTWISAGLIAAFACQFQPLLRMLPLAVFAFIISDRRGRKALRNWKVWAAFGIFALLLLDTVLIDLYKMETGQGPARNPIESLTIFTKVFFEPDVTTGAPGNTFLDASITPPVFTYLVIAGFLLGLLKVDTSIKVVVIASTAIIYTFPGVMLRNIGAARLQLQAQPFYLLLAGHGLGILIDLIPNRYNLRRIFANVVPVIVVGLPVILWPGPIGKLFTPQLERRVIIEGISKISDGCRIVWPAMKLKSTVPMPVYLTIERKRQIDWRQIWDTEPPPPIDRTQCMIYYRPVACYDHDMPAPEEKDRKKGELRYECATLESKMSLTPLFLQKIPAMPDATQSYSQDPMEIGFFKLNL